LKYRTYRIRIFNCLQAVVDVSGEGGGDIQMQEVALL